MGKRKADQIRATGAKYVVAPCANCKKQLNEVIEDHKIENVEIIGLHDLLLRAMDYSGLPQVERDEDDDDDWTPPDA